jgi:hypothetical protein
MHKALHAGPLSIALRHLELARLHRERRSELRALESVLADGAPIAIDRTDKEG